MHTRLLAAPSDSSDTSSLAANAERNPWRQFVPGPVPIAEHILAIGQRQLPYNRTTAFSQTTQEILDGLKYLFQTDGAIALLTASGTAAMEASVLNFFDTSDRALVVNGGTFGQRWCDLCEAHSAPHNELPVTCGEDLDLTRLEEMLSTGRYSALLINAHETSTGHLYDIEAIGKIARRHDVLFIVDAISSICADAFSMDDWNVDVAVLSSHKALALPPGLSFVAMGDRAVSRLEGITPKSLYLNLKDYLENQRRGQLPYTPAIGLLMQLHQRLRDIREESLPTLIARHRERAETFRTAMADSQFDVLPSRSSNAITALNCRNLDAARVAEELQSHHRIIVAPSGGALKSKLIRIAHMGAQDPDDVQHLISALCEIDAQSRERK